MRKEFSTMEKSCPSTPQTPTVVKGELRRKLMKARSSIGIARMKQMKLATRLPDNDDQEEETMELIMPVTPVTRQATAQLEKVKQINTLKNSPLTRNRSKQLDQLEMDVDQTSEALIEPITPKRKTEIMDQTPLIEPASNNDSILSLNLSISKSVNIAENNCDLDPLLDTLDGLELEEITTDPATKLISPNISQNPKTANLLDNEDSFDYAREMKSIRMDTVMKTPTPTPQEAEIDTKNEQYLRLLSEIETTFSGDIDLSALCATSTTSVKEAGGLLQQAIHSNLTVTEAQMNKIFVSQLQRKMRDSKPTSYQIELVQNLSEKVVHSLELVELEPMAKMAAECLFIKEISKMRKTLIEPNQELEKLVASIRKSVPNEEELKSEINSLKKHHQTVINQVDAIKRRVESGESTSQSVGMLKTDNEQKMEALASLKAQIKEIENQNKGNS